MHVSVSGLPLLIYLSHISLYVSMYFAFHINPHVNFLPPLDSFACPDFFTFPPLSGKMGTNGMGIDLCVKRIGPVKSRHCVCAG